MLEIAFWMVVWAFGVLISMVYYQYFLKHSYWYTVNYRLLQRSDTWLHRCNYLGWPMFAWMMFVLTREDKIEDLENIH